RESPWAVVVGIVEGRRLAAAGRCDGEHVQAEVREQRPDLDELERAPGIETGPEDERAAFGRAPLAGYKPIGCQTVFSSRKLEISQGLCTSARPRTTRLTLSAASCSSSAASPSAPQTSSAFTSMCDASHGAISFR